MATLRILRSEAETPLFPKVCFLCQTETDNAPQCEDFTYDPNRTIKLVGALLFFKMALLAMSQSRSGLRQSVDLVFCPACARSLGRTRRFSSLVTLLSIGACIAAITYACYDQWILSAGLGTAAILIPILYWTLWYRKYTIECLKIDEKWVTLEAAPGYVTMYQLFLDKCDLCPHCHERLLPGTRSCFHCGRGGVT